jgi:hypothetical protein
MHFSLGYNNTNGMMKEKHWNIMRSWTFYTFYSNMLQHDEIYLLRILHESLNWYESTRHNWQNIW